MRIDIAALGAASFYSHDCVWHNGGKSLRKTRSTPNGKGTAYLTASTVNPRDLRKAKLAVFVSERRPRLSGHHHCIAFLERFGGKVLWRYNQLSCGVRESPPAILFDGFKRILAGNSNLALGSSALREAASKHGQDCD